MQRDDETTARELVVTLRANGISLSTTTAWKGWRLLGWTRRGTTYCQLIPAPNCAKRLEWVCQNLGKSLENVILTDETTVQMESHRHFHCYKRGSKPRHKPRPVEVHVWVGRWGSVLEELATGWSVHGCSCVHWYPGNLLDSFYLWGLSYWAPIHVG